jgi:hypothetical protein
MLKTEWQWRATNILLGVLLAGSTDPLPVRKLVNAARPLDDIRLMS